MSLLYARSDIVRVWSAVSPIKKLVGLMKCEQVRVNPDIAQPRAEAYIVPAVPYIVKNCKGYFVVDSYTFSI